MAQGCLAVRPGHKIRVVRLLTKHKVDVVVRAWPCVCADVDVLIAACVPVCAGTIRELFALHGGVNIPAGV